MKNKLKYLIPISLVVLLNFVIGCKQPSENNYNTLASIQAGDELIVNPLLENVITTSINFKDNTMSILYANGVAWSYASSQTDLNYPLGSILYEVTWQQKPDSVWFGANIPKRIIKIESIDFTKSEFPLYTLYKGSPLKKVMSDNNEERITTILSQRIAVVP